MYEATVNDLLKAALIFLRIGGIMFALPIFGDDSTPVRVRILLSAALTAGLYQLVPVGWASTFPTDVIAVGLMILRELLIGMVLGFVAKGMFEGLTMAASIVGFQMGFGTANLLMPEIDMHANSFTALHRVLMMLLFMGLSLHHIFIQAITDSFALIPAGMAFPHAGLGDVFIKLTAGIFVVSLQLAAPILVALLFTMAALGLLARTVPQINVFVMSFPASFFIGLLIYVATLPFFPGWMRDYFQSEQAHLFTAMRGLVQ